MTRKDVNVIFASLALVGIMALVGCWEQKVEEKPVVKYHQKFEVQDDFYGRGDCITTGVRSNWSTRHQYAIVGDCQFDTGYAGSMSYAPDQIVLK